MFSALSAPKSQTRKRDRREKERGAERRGAYERGRKGEIQIASNFMDILDHTFRSSHPLVRTTRGFGFNLVNKLDPLKSLLIRGATGSCDYVAESNK